MPFSELTEKYQTERQKSKIDDFNTYNPQFTNGKPYECKRGSEAEVFSGVKNQKSDHITKNDGKRYPKTVLKFNKETGSHPTQKPIALLEYLIKTYTNEGETVLDFTAGSMSTVIASLNTKRNCIAIEKDDNYFDIGCKRVHKHMLDNNINLCYNQVYGGVVLWQNSKTERAKDTEGF